LFGKSYPAPDNLKQWVHEDANNPALDKWKNSDTNEKFMVANDLGNAFIRKYCAKSGCGTCPLCLLIAYLANPSSQSDALHIADLHNKMYYADWKFRVHMDHMTHLEKEEEKKFNASNNGTESTNTQDF